MISVQGDNVEVSCFENNRSIKHYPCDSSKLGIVQLGSESEKKTVSANYLFKKCLMFTINDRSYIIPLLHID